VQQGVLPSDLVIGRWWASSGPQCEVDVLGLRGRHTALLGDARWQERALDARAVAELRAKLARVPSPAAEPLVALWARSGITRAAKDAGALGWSLSDVLEA
jgi:hypothetical protein